ncbi:AMP-binding protein [Streptomyces sp. NPDC026672]|uniref:AMP-binding protein n=1 Tax=unclassified Streptomyces TaxID=2593676 RepID=UPI0034054E2B
MPRSLAVDIMERAQRTPDAPALLCGNDGGQAVSYAGLAAAADRIGAELAARYPDPRRPLALQAARSVTALAAVLACLRDGRPLLAAPADLAPATLTELADRSGCQGVLGVAGDELTHRHVGAGRRAVPALPPGTALLLTAPGGDELPEVVPLGAGGIDAFTSWVRVTFAIGAGTRVLGFAPLDACPSLLETWATLRHGGTVIPVDHDRTGDPEYLPGLLEATRPHVVQAAPPFLRLLAGAGDGGTFPGMREVLLTGGQVPGAVRAGLRRVFPVARLHGVYGCTETNSSMMRTVGPHETADLDVLPLGGPLPGALAEVVSGGAVLQGAGTGELVVSTPFQAAGYLGGRGGQDRFVVRGDRVWFRTGDVVRRTEDGELCLVDGAGSRSGALGAHVAPA